MKYKMLVLDLDDTLLTDDHTISVENAAMLFKARELEFILFEAQGARKTHKRHRANFLSR
jgi:hydroxymethylpyrimidine pyrophosphatase-like HAD family hydrolase